MSFSQSPIDTGIDISAEGELIERSLADHMHNITGNDTFDGRRITPPEAKMCDEDEERLQGELDKIDGEQGQRVRMRRKWEKDDLIRVYETEVAALKANNDKLSNKLILFRQQLASIVGVIQDMVETLGGIDIHNEEQLFNVE